MISEIGTKVRATNRISGETFIGYIVSIQRLQEEVSSVIIDIGDEYGNIYHAYFDIEHWEISNEF